MSEGTFDPTQYLVKINGRADYLEVRYRLLWLRSDHPDADLDTRCLEHAPGESASFWARVVIPGGGAATGHGVETAGDFRDYYEKAETKAIGRALAALGYGTQFCLDHDFGGDSGAVVDAPSSRPRPQPTPRAGTTPGREPAPRSAAPPSDRPAAVPSAAGPPSPDNGKRAPTFAEARQYALDETISPTGRLRAATIALELAGSLDELADTYSKVMALPERGGLKETYETRHKALKELEAVPI